MSDNDPNQDESLALDFVLGNLPDDQRRLAEIRLANDAAFREEVAVLEDSFSIFTLSAEAKSPRPDLRDELMRRIGGGEIPEPVESEIPENLVKIRESNVANVREIAAWVAAVLFGAFGIYTWSLLTSSQQEVVQLRAEVQDAREYAKLEIESLKATIGEYEKGVAVVIWDQDSQSGVLKLEQMPPLKQDQDYQLWVVDPNYQNPVDSGVITMGPDGFAQVKFKPRDEITSAQKFAISVEKKGGVPVAQGPIVLLSP